MATPGLNDYFEYGLCVDFNLNDSACAQNFLSVTVPFEEIFFMSLSKIFSSTPYDPLGYIHGGVRFNVLQVKYGYLVDFGLTLGAIILIPELLIFIKRRTYF